MEILYSIWEWIKEEANAWFWIIVGSLFLFGMALLTDSIDWLTKKMYKIRD